VPRARHAGREPPAGWRRNGGGSPEVRKVTEQGDRGGRDRSAAHRILPRRPIAGRRVSSQLGLGRRSRHRRRRDVTCGSHPRQPPREAH
jgi:hypothetical protein